MKTIICIMFIACSLYAHVVETSEIGVTTCMLNKSSMCSMLVFSEKEAHVLFARGCKESGGRIVSKPCDRGDSLVAACMVPKAPKEFSTVAYYTNDEKILSDGKHWCGVMGGAWVYSKKQ